MATEIFILGKSEHLLPALKFCFKTCVAMKFVDDDDDDCIEVLHVLQYGVPDLVLFILFTQHTQL